MTETRNVKIDAEEWWPVYEITLDARTSEYWAPISVPVSLLARYDAALKEWKEVQEEITKLVDDKRRRA